MGRYYVTTTIPYVNGKPHLGHALELVQADVLARHRRRHGDTVRFQTGTDDNALKNVRGAEAEGVPTADYVARGARRFEALGQALQLSFDDFVKTSSDPRHRPGVDRLWAACADSGDFYKKTYAGRYCVGCERYYASDELVAGRRCPEHGTEPELVEEENWFFRLSRYTDGLIDLVDSGRLRIEPESRRREVRAFLAAGLDDFSVSRTAERARGWGIPVPGDPGQVVYVWFDALANYITAPGYATDAATFARWWGGEGVERVHLVGKGVVRFHAVYWPAMLWSAGLRLPDTIFVHEYLTDGGAKIGKSAGNGADPSDLVAAYGADALRWWLLRDVARSGDTDFVPARLVDRANADLVNNLGNLVHRTVSMVARYRDGVVGASAPQNRQAADLRRARQEADTVIAAALGAFDFRAAAAAVTRVGDEGNRYVEAARPWELAKTERGGADPAALDAVLGELVAACRDIGRFLEPFLPAAAARIAACTETARGGGTDATRLPHPQRVFGRLPAPDAA